VEKLETQYEVFNAIYEDALPKSLEYFLGIAGAMDFDDDDKDDKS
jgi:hypothetical protein